MCNDQDRYEYEISRELWEEIHRKGQDYLLKEDPDFIEWLERIRLNDLLYQMRDTHDNG